MQTIQRDVQDFVDQRSLDEYFPNSYTVITLSLAAWGLAQIFVPWEMLDLLVCPCHLFDYQDPVDSSPVCIIC